MWNHEVEIHRFESWSKSWPHKQVFIWVWGGVRRVWGEMRNVQDEKILTVGMEKNCGGKKRGF